MNQSDIDKVNASSAEQGHRLRLQEYCLDPTHPAYNTNSLKLDYKDLMNYQKKLAKQADVLMNRLYEIAMDEAIKGNADRSNRAHRIAELAFKRYCRRYDAFRQSG